MPPPYYGTNTLGALGLGLSNAVKSALPWAQLFSRPDPNQDEFLRLLAQAGLGNMRQAAGHRAGAGGAGGENIPVDKYPFENIKQAGEAGAAGFGSKIGQEGAIADTEVRPEMGNPLDRVFGSQFANNAGEILPVGKPLSAEARSHAGRIYNAEAAAGNVPTELNLMPDTSDKPVYGPNGEIVQSMDFGPRTDQPLDYKPPAVGADRGDAVAGANRLARDIFNEQTANMPSEVKQRIEMRIAESNAAIDASTPPLMMHPALAPMMKPRIDAQKAAAQKAIEMEEMARFKQDTGKDWYYSQHPEMRQENIGERVIGREDEQARLAREAKLEGEKISQWGSLKHTEEQKREFEAGEKKGKDYVDAENKRREEAGEPPLTQAEGEALLKREGKWEPKGGKGGPANPWINPADKTAYEDILKTIGLLEKEKSKFATVAPKMAAGKQAEIEAQMQRADEIAARNNQPPLPRSAAPKAKMTRDQIKAAHPTATEEQINAYLAGK